MWLQIGPHDGMHLICALSILCSPIVQFFSINTFPMQQRLREQPDWHLLTGPDWIQTPVQANAPDMMLHSMPLHYEIWEFWQSTSKVPA